jgi:NTE family protein
MNAAIMIGGFMEGGASRGHEQARENLEKFWAKISEAGSAFSPQNQLQHQLQQNWSSFWPDFSKFMPVFPSTLPFQWLETISRSFSPYQFNPLNLNPLKDILDDMVDFDRLRACKKEGKLFVTATNIRTGNARIFETHEITRDVLLASAALPFLFHAVEIDGEHYWDGGYMGNPSLWPLFYRAETPDILIVHVNPLIREGVPQTAFEIENRLNEITFNGSLLKELRAVAFVQKLLRDDMLKPEFRKDYRDMLLHAIRAEDSMKDLSVASKFDTSWPFLTGLRDMGRDMAREWLKGEFEHVGQRSTIQIGRDYLSPRNGKLNKAA